MYNLKIGEVLHGFRINEKRELPDVSAVMYIMEYEKNGARLLFLDRVDVNKTFSVAFKTIPENSTGVFHIIEHSVLCGSEKFPVKEPFVELLKGSLQTFLNAMTYPDKTVYPVSSRNERDFLNLTEVYLDAVFKPLMKTNKGVFLQEGWRREIGDDGKISYNGVVFNEMKGVYSSPDDLSESIVTSMLYGDSPYALDSGGDPNCIRDLSYEEFCRSHSENYHPSNAYFFLDGEIDLDASLKLIEAYISGYEKAELQNEISTEVKCGAKDKVAEYEISSGESTENKDRLILGCITTRYDEMLETTALDVLLETISSGNDSPLKKAVMESGFCEKMNVSNLTGKARNNVFFEFQNIKDGKLAELEELYRSTLMSIREDGVDKDALAASINHLEFMTREKNTGGFPIGVAYALSVLDTWLYGGDPAASLSYTELFGELRKLLKSNYFENLIDKYFISNENSVRLIMKPSATLGKQRAEREEKRAEEDRKTLTAEAVEKIKSESAMLSSWQSSEDTEEALATLPQLALSDISNEVSDVPTEVSELSGQKLIRHDMDMAGIRYADILFDVSDVTDYAALSIFTSMLTMSGTDKLDGFAFENMKKRELGSLSASNVLYSNGGELRLYVKISGSMLEGKRDKFLEILKEFLYSTTLDDKNALRNIVMQNKIGAESAFVSSGDMLGFIRCASYTNGKYAVLDRLRGYEFYTEIKAIEKDFDSYAPQIIEKIKNLRNKIFKKERAVFAVTGEKDTIFEASLADILACGGASVQPLTALPLGDLSEGFAIPAQVGFGIRCATIPELENEPKGALRVAKMILNYEYLWSEVRVKGGAYGVGLRTTAEGIIACTSFRDPTPAASLGVFARTADFLENFANASCDLTKYIIGALGEYEPYYSKPYEASLATAEYMSGVTKELRKRIKREIIECNKSSLLEMASILRKYEKESLTLTIAPPEKLAYAKTIITIA